LFLKKELHLIYIRPLTPRRARFPILRRARFLVPRRARFLIRRRARFLMLRRARLVLRRARPAPPQLQQRLHLGGVQGLQGYLAHKKTPAPP